MRSAPQKLAVFPYLHIYTERTPMDNLTYEKHLISKAARSHTPINGSLELLPLCNMNCGMCYVRLSRPEMERQGHLHSAAEWISLARQMQKSGTLFLLLTGGEPLLFPDFKTLYLELRSMGMILTINTNGTLIDETWADFFAQYPPRRINITLYGTSKETYRDLCHYKDGFEKALRGIRLLRERNVDVKINGSLVRSNSTDVDSLVALARSLDAPINIDTYMYPARRERSAAFCEQSRLLPEDAARGKVQFEKASLDSKTYLQMAQTIITRVSETPDTPEPDFQRMRCQAGRTSFTINWQGKMRPCVMLSQPEINVFETGFDNAWKQLQCEIETITLNPRCSSCSLRRICQTCAACAKLEAGAYDGIPDYMCRYTKELLHLYSADLAASRA